jgi:hypothetical protein
LPNVRALSGGHARSFNDALAIARLIVDPTLYDDESDTEIGGAPSHVPLDFFPFGNRIVPKGNYYRDNNEFV